MRLLCLCVLIAFVDSAPYDVGFFGFGIDFEQSGDEFKQKVTEYRSAANGNATLKHFVDANHMVFRTSAFYVSKNGKARIPAMLAEVRDKLCFMHPFYLPIRETYITGPSPSKNSTMLSFVSPSYTRLRERLVNSLTRHGFLPFEKEENSHFWGAENRSPNQIIAASIPKPDDVPSFSTGMLPSEVKLDQYVTVYLCKNGWFELDCEAVKSDFIIAQCRNKA